MKILTISDVYFPRVNGVSTSIATFRQELTALGHETLLVVPDYGEPLDDESGIRRLRARSVPMDPEDFMMSRRDLLALEDELRAQNFDVVHIQTPFVAHWAGVPLARKLRLPIVETYHTYFEQYLFHYIPYLPKAMMTWTARHFSRNQCEEVDSVIVPSTAMEEALRRYGVSTPIVRLPTGLRLEELQGGDGRRFRKAHGIDLDRPTLVYVGRVAHEKNLDFLLDMTAAVRREIPDILWIVAGEGPAQKHLKRRGERMGLSGHLHFVGYLDRESELLDCYKAGDAFVFASETETQGLVLLEAMALGVPVVSTAVMGTRDVLREDHGAWIAPQDVDGFARRVVRLLRDEEAHALLTASAKAEAERWSARRMAERLVDVYRDLTGPESSVLRAA